MRKAIIILITVLLGVGSLWKLSHRTHKAEVLTRKDVPLLKKPDELLIRHIVEGPKEINTLQDKANQKSLHEGDASWVGVYRLELVAVPINKNRKVALGLYINNSIGQQLSPKNTTMYLQPVLSDGTTGDQLRPLRIFGDGLFVTTDKYPGQMPQKYLVTGVINGQKFSVTFNINNFRSRKIIPNEN
jgi:hypothetical protein